MKFWRKKRPNECRFVATRCSGHTQHFTISHVPTFVIPDNNGNKLGRLFGYSRDFFWGNLEKIVEPLRDGHQFNDQQPTTIDPRDHGDGE
ncbi:MAG: hypothetical protein HQL69_20080 [Magnetococcales bacterium]|nr:hypothetical protein [Magnetococcales bacterium]